MKVAYLLLFLLVTSFGTYAQNSDLGLLGGPTIARWSSSGPSMPTSEVRVGAQINYAYEVVERPAGRLYVELPVFVPIVPVQEPNSTRIFATPGMRYHYNLTTRTAVYASAGLGFGVRPQSPAASLAYSVGVGLDYRLNRRWSLRFDTRKLFASSSVSYQDDAPFTMAGIGLHF